MQASRVCSPGAACPAPRSRRVSGARATGSDGAWHSSKGASSRGAGVWAEAAAAQSSSEPLAVPPPNAPVLSSSNGIGGMQHWAEKSALDILRSDGHTCTRETVQRALGAQRRVRRAVQVCAAPTLTRLTAIAPSIPLCSLRQPALRAPLLPAASAGVEDASTQVRARCCAAPSHLTTVLPRHLPRPMLATCFAHPLYLPWKTLILHCSSLSSVQCDGAQEAWG